MDKGSALLVVVGLILGLAGLIGVTIFHYKALSMISRHYVTRDFKLGSFVLVMCGAIAIHTIEILNFAVLMAVGDKMGLGSIAGSKESFFLDYIYYSAITYTSVGYGDLAPTEGMRVIAAITALSGLMLVALSGSFLSALLQRHDANRSLEVHSDARKSHFLHFPLPHGRQGEDSGPHTEIITTQTVSTETVRVVPDDDPKAPSPPVKPGSNH